ncbi:chemotaxis protein CheA [Motiliproteus sp. MSK22-1]|uniref:chemotaxis protein CheA n=1 Tax=Motiliproteus sp. MSK22-1 TaxID=1897630 RepID=UPI000976CA3F|nr:chemotaxis protein CheA [Motiliproteus sp. MSK22-1]OMH32141.1 hypothetical protein BGP75_15710 [Motiliproteus sp. MSK22-1]
MSIDLSQFREVFFEESFEGLAVMESHLLILDASDTEALHAIFRAAHSIKGGAGMFNFKNIVEFTHIVETLLDELRSGKRAINVELESLLLKSVDAIKDLLHLAQEDDTTVPDDIQDIQRQLKCMLEGNSQEESSPIESDLAAENEQTNSEGEAKTGNEKPVAEAAVTNGWEILFTPHDHMLLTGNEPLHMLSALTELGDLEVKCDCSKVPLWQELSPEQCYLSWSMQLYGDIAKEDVEEVFAWVEDDCELNITSLGSATAADSADSSSESSITEISSPEPSATVQPDSSQSTPITSPEAGMQSSDNPAKITADEVAPTASQADEDRRQGDRRKQSDRRGTLERRTGGETNSIRVSTQKIDTLINRVGELVITQSMLGQVSDNIETLNQKTINRLKEGLVQLERNTREIQEDVMQIRMLPISFVFNRFPRLVHDLQTQLGKRIELVISGEGTELDKTLMEKISDPLVHLVRNSIDHGIEMPEDRKSCNKPEAGRVDLEAYHQGGNIIIEIRDDGKGLDIDKILRKAREKGLVGEGEIPEQKQIFDLIMQPGFSTAEQVSDLSGRGVGMDVVGRNINELGGSVEISSESGKGSCFRISLPLTLAILDGQQVELGEQICIIPLVSIVESLQVPVSQINAIAGKDRLYSFRGDYIPLVSLRQVMGQPTDSEKENLVVVVEANGQPYGLIVDGLLGQQQFVIKSLEENYRKVEGVAGATILGSGRVGLILDVGGLLRLNRQQNIDSNSLQNSSLYNSSQTGHQVLQFKAG